MRGREGEEIKGKCKHIRTVYAIARAHVLRNDRVCIRTARTYVPLGVYVPVEFVEVERGDDEAAAATAQYHRGGQELLPRHDVVDVDVDVDGRMMLTTMVHDIVARTVRH